MTRVYQKTKTGKPYFAIILGLLLPSILFAQGDRKPEMNCIYPDDAFVHTNKGGRIFDITQPPFNAVGDGVTDDTHAFIQAYDTVLAIMDSYGWEDGQPVSYQCSNIIYIPDGTYRITNTIIYSGASRFVKPNEKLARIRFIGQSREGTILKLDDNCSGYKRGTNKQLLSFGYGDFNNGVAFNAVRNLTLNTGSGNPGAVALYYGGANNGSINNITIKSEDGQGSIGLHLNIGTVIGYHHDITIEGFDYGIYTVPYHFAVNTFEYITLKNQNIAAARTDNSSLICRKLLSENNVTAITIEEAGAQVVIIDSELKKSSAGGSTIAINLKNGQLFARNVVVNGYANEIVNRNTKVNLPISGEIDEYVSGKIFSLRDGQTSKTLNLDIEENPVVTWENDISQWANVNDYGAIGDGVSDSYAAIQAAMNSGKSTIYFPDADYYTSAGVNVPATVKNINFMYGRMTGGYLRVNENSEDPLFIEDGLSKGAVIGHYAPRTIVCNNFSGNYINLNSSSGAKLFLNNCTNFGKTEDRFVNMKVWARWINTEYKTGPNFVANNSNMWVLGYKVEGNTTSFKAMNDGKIEVLGGIANEWGTFSSGDNRSIVINDDSDVCFIGFTNGPNTLKYAVQEITDNGTKYLTTSSLPERTGQYSDRFIPLYVSYKETSTDIEDIPLQKINETLELRYSPVSQTLLASSSQDSDDQYIYIYDINGRKMLNAKSSYPINVSNLANGIYLVQSNNKTAKFIKY